MNCSRIGGRVALVALGAAALVALVVLAVSGVFSTRLDGASAPAIGAALADDVETSKGRDRTPFAPAAEGSDVPHTELPLRLVATIVRENPKLSLATVEDREQGGHQVMNEGQSFRNYSEARVVSVERGRVLIDNDGVREQLVIDRSARLPPVNAASDETLAYRHDLSQRLRELTDAGTDYRELRPLQGSGLLDEGEVRPVYENGELVGVQLAALREGGVYEQVGLRDGDVVTSVNGVSLGEPTAAAEVLAQLAFSDELTVAVQRDDGTEELLSVPTADFAEVLVDLE